MLKKLFALTLTLCCTLCAAATCEEAAKYPAAALTTPEQVDTVRSLTRVNAEGTFYMLDYTADYALDALLAADVADLQGLVG